MDKHGGAKLFCIKLQRERIHVTSFDIDVCKLQCVSVSKSFVYLHLTLDQERHFWIVLSPGDLPLETFYFINVQFVFINVQVGGAGGSWHGR